MKTAKNIIPIEIGIETDLDVSFWEFKNFFFRLIYGKKNCKCKMELKKIETEKEWWQEFAYIWFCSLEFMTYSIGTWITL